MQHCHPPTYYEEHDDNALPPAYALHVHKRASVDAIPLQCRQVANVTYTDTPCSGSSMHRKPSPWQSKKALKVAIAAAGCLSSRVEIAAREDDRDIRSWIDQRKACQVDVILPDDFMGTLFVYKNDGSVPLGPLLRLTATKNKLSTKSKARGAMTVYDINSRGTLKFSTISRKDVCEVLTDGAVVSVRYQSEGGIHPVHSL